MTRDPNSSNLRRGIRSPDLRKVFDRAVAQGWRAEVDGNGHLRLTRPDGRARFSMSMSANGGGRGYENVRSMARRSGLDVRGL